MNSVNLTGRLTRDPDVRYANNGTTIARFTLAVNRKFKSESGPDADFPSVVVFGKSAEFVEKYFHKGMKMEVSGRLQTGSYTKEDGTKVYTTDVVAESVEFGESKNASESNNEQNGATPNLKTANGGFMDIPEGVEDELPFL